LNLGPANVTSGTLNSLLSGVENGDAGNPRHGGLEQLELFRA
jgi:hypothetical protein